MQCTYKNKDGKQCKANAMKNSEYCFFHSQEHEGELKVAQARGGKANAITVQNPMPPMTIKSAQDVVLLLEDTINQVRAGELDVKIGNCIGVLSGHLIKALEVTSVTNRIEVIERAILERKTTF
jgi:hypothetical protein